MVLSLSVIPWVLLVSLVDLSLIQISVCANPGLVEGGVPSLVTPVDSVIDSEEYYSSVFAMRSLLVIRKEMIKNLINLVDKTRAQLDVIQRTAFNTFESTIVDENYPETLISNFLHTFKRFEVKKSIFSAFRNIENSYWNTISTLNQLLPGEGEYSEIVNGMIRLRSVYDLPVSELMDGILLNHKTNITLSVRDTFLIGLEAYRANDTYEAIFWFEAARRRVTITNGLTNSSHVNDLLMEILDYEAFAHYTQGNTYAALSLTKHLMELDPDNERFSENVAWYEDEINDLLAKDLNYSKNNFVGADDTFVNIKPQKGPWYKYIAPDSYERYVNLCRSTSNKFSDSKLVNQKPYCYLYTGNSLTSKLNPYRVEVVSKDPIIMLFHNFVSSQEIEHLKNKSYSMLRRAKVVNSKTYAGESILHRVSQSAWIYEGDVQIERIERRISLLTGLNASGHEIFQIGNYGIGGQYDPHVDFSDDPDNPLYSRIATFMIYLSEVPLGGFTVFPELGLAIKPQKGAAIFWYNLHSNGTGNYDTRHASCPVLLGSKWVANKWIHAYSKLPSATCHPGKLW